jgi:hypothetical protein
MQRKTQGINLFQHLKEIPVQSPLPSTCFPYFSYLAKTATREERAHVDWKQQGEREGFMVSPVLHYGVFGLLQMNRREFQVYHEEQGIRRRRRSRKSGNRTHGTIRRRKKI